jgi:hypothetical protein
MHSMNRSVSTPMVELPFETLCPGNEALQKLMGQFR